MVARDARNPNTTADRDPRAFGTIDASEAEAAEKAGPGVIEPERHDPTGGLDEHGNSTFASRRAERDKATTRAVQRSDSGQRAENKSVQQ